MSLTVPAKLPDTALTQYVFAVPQPKKRKSEVLDEDNYTAVLEHIVERDFFPDLPKLRQAVAKRAGTSMTAPFSTGSATESVEPVVDVAGLKVPAELSLGEFLDNYTSEDNASFDALMEEQQRKHREKYAWAYVEEFKNQQNRLRLTHGDSSSAPIALLTDASASSKSVTVKSTSANQIVAAPTASSADAVPENYSITKSASQLADERAEAELRPIEPGTWPYRAANTLFYIPDGCSAEQAHDNSLSVFAKPKLVVHSATRFQPKTASAAPTPVSKVPISSSATPRVNGFSLPSTPAIAPGDGGASPMMTWGAIVGTPQHIVSEDVAELVTNDSSDGRSFRIAAVSSRDALARRLADSTSASRTQQRATARAALSAASPALAAVARLQTPQRVSIESRVAQMSPAAQAMLRSRSSKGGDTQLRASYTPVINRIGTGTSSRVVGSTPAHSVPLTPQVASGLMRRPTSLTDDLL